MSFSSLFPGSGAHPVVGALAALILGASGSLHCLLMCGPLACTAIATPSRVHLSLDRAQSLRRRLHAAVAYHVGRITAYTVVGALLGAFGSAFSRAVAMPLRGVLSWVLAAALLASALDLGKRIAPLPGIAKLLRNASRASARLSPAFRSLTLGALTPFIPCALLYGVFAAGFATGSAFGGAALLAAFAVGGAPALVAAQVPAGMGIRLAGWKSELIRRGLPALAAVLVIYRTLAMAKGHSCH